MLHTCYPDNSDDTSYRGQLKNPAISGALFTLRLRYKYTQTQCEEGARDFRILQLTPFSSIFALIPVIPLNSENITDRLRYIEISVGRSFEDDVTGEIQTESGTHLIVFPSETKCGDNSYSSDPAIINYYRQFFMRLDGELSEGTQLSDFLNLSIIRVFGGVSAIISHQIKNIREYNEVELRNN